MKSFVVSLVVACLFAIGISGCAKPNASQVAADAVETTPPPPAGVNLVKLKLPGMVCGGCAMEVKDT
jgi:hypothetical protein